MRRYQSTKKSVGSILPKDVLSSLTLNCYNDDSEFPERFKAIEEFEKQLDEDMRITSEDLEREFL